MRVKIKISVNNLHDDIYQYQGFSEGKRLFSVTFTDTSEGITEFTGAVHGLMHLKKYNLNGDVVVRNPYIKDCLENKSYKHSVKGEKASEFLRKCHMWLLEQKSGINVILEEENKVENASTDVPDVSEEFLDRKTWFNRD